MRDCIVEDSLWIAEGKDLRTVAGRTFDTYRDTAISLGLTDSDAEFHQPVEECARNRTA